MKPRRTVQRCSRCKKKFYGLAGSGCCAYCGHALDARNRRLRIERKEKRAATAAEAVR